MEISGHAYFDVIGRDIVCAAVSTLIQTLALRLENIDDLHHVDCEHLYYVGYEGTRPQIRKIMADGREAMSAYETVMAGLRAIADQYPDNLNLVEGGL